MQSYLTPDPFHLLVFNLLALHSQETVGQPPAPAHMAQGELLDPNAQLLLSSFFKRHGPALGIAVLTRYAVGTALVNSRSLLQNHDSSAPTF